MTRIEDDKLQELLGEGKLTKKEIDKNPEAKLYSFLFDSLKKTPENNLSPGFSSRVLSKVEARDVKPAWYGMFPTIVVSMGFLIFLLAALAVAGANLTFLDSLFEFKWYVVIGVFMILFMQLVDKKLIRTEI